MTGGGSSSSQLQQRISNKSFLGHGLDSTSTVQNGLGVPLYFTDNPPPSVVPVTSSPPRTTYRPSVDLSNTNTMMPTRPSSYSSPPRYNPPAPIYHPPTTSTRLSTSSLPSRSLPLPMPSVSTPIRNSPSRYEHEQHVQSTQAITSAPPQKTTSSQSQSQLPPPLHFTNTSPDRLHYGEHSNIIVIIIICIIIRFPWSTSRHGVIIGSVLRSFGGRAVKIT